MLQGAEAMKRTNTAGKIEFDLTHIVRTEGRASVSGIKTEVTSQPQLATRAGTKPYGSNYMNYLIIKKLINKRAEFIENTPNQRRDKI